MLIATDPLSLFFVGCFLFGLLYLAVAVLLGGLGHGHATGHSGGHGFHAGANGGHAHTGVHGGHEVAPSDAKGAQVGQGNAPSASSHSSMLSMLNPMSIVLFLVGFGFFGYVLKNLSGLGLSLVFIISLLGGLAIAGLILYLMNRIFGTGEATTVQDISDRTGLVGKVNMTIRENSLGEILYVSPGGMRKSIPARSIDGRRIERDQEVVVVNYQKGIAEVDTWEHFINQEEKGEAPLLEADDLGQLRTLLDDLKRTDAEYVIGKDTQKE